MSLYTVQILKTELMTLHVHSSHRFMLGLAGVPSILMLLGMLFMPESPRWLVYHGKEEKARKALLKVRSADLVQAELDSIREDFEKQKKLKLGECVSVCVCYHC